MDCPVCKSAMITCQLESVEVDHCLECKGIWLDAGELEALLEDPEQAKQVLSSFKLAKKTGEKIRKCPICLKKMEKVLVGQKDSQKMLDRCKKGDGLWFDKGELLEVLATGQFDRDNKVQNLLAEMFADKQV